MRIVIIDDAVPDRAKREAARQGVGAPPEGTLQSGPICHLLEEASSIDQHLKGKAVKHQCRSNHHVHSIPLVSRAFDLAHKEAQAVAALLARDRRHCEAVVDAESVLNHAGRSRQTFPEAIAHPKILRDTKRRTETTLGGGCCALAASGYAAAAPPSRVRKSRRRMSCPRTRPTI
jgi:hypothetical protein